jgi:outer membrane protein TolC
MNKTIFLKALLYLNLLFGASTLLAQDKELSLSDALALSLSNSPLVKSVRYNFAAEQWRFKAEKALLLPQLGLNGQLPGFTRAINQIQQPDGSILFRPQSQNFSAATLSLSQNLLHTGGTLSLNSGLSRIDLFETTPDQNRIFWRAAPLFVQFSQPLFQINRIRWNWEQQKIAMDQAQQNRTERIAELEFRVVQQYFDVCLAKIRYENALANTANNDTIYKISQGRFNVGKIAENELLQVELGLMNARNELETNRLSLQNLEKELRMLLGLPTTGESYKVSLPTNIPIALIDPELAAQEALQNRSDFKSLELMENQARMNLRSAEISRRLTADLNLSIGYNQTAPIISEAITNLQSSQSAFVSLNVPIHNAGRNKALVEVSRNRLNATLTDIQYRKGEIELEISNQIARIRQLYNSYIISAKADTIARKRYELAKNRYLIGKTDITNLTIAQQEKDIALINYVESLRAYWLAWYALRRSTLYDFERQQKLSALYE